MKARSDLSDKSDGLGQCPKTHRSLPGIIYSGAILPAAQKKSISILFSVLHFYLSIIDGGKAAKMMSWDDLDSFKLSLQPNFQATSRPNPSWQGGFQHAHQTFVPPTQSKLSLDRYLQLLQLLCGGQPSTATGAAANTWTVRQLGELERAAVKMEDLKKVLAVNGRVISAKNKQDMLDKIAGLQLACPVLIAPTLSTPAAAAASETPLAVRNQNPLLETAQKHELQQSMQRALQWADLSPLENTLAAAAISRQGCYSFCPLPEIKLPLSHISSAEDALAIEEGFQEQGLGYAPQQQPATSATTFASRPAFQHAQIAESSLPSSSFSSPVDKAAAADVIEKDTEMQDAVLHYHQNSSPCPPEWLISGYKKVAAICVGIKNLPLEKKSSRAAATIDTINTINSPSKPIIMGSNLVGRKVALVMAEDFQQGGGGSVEGDDRTNLDDDIIDTVARGIHLGQVIEWIGHQHDSHVCPIGCTQHHNFCYVRVTPTETTAPAHKRGRRRLDLEVDLREDFRLETLEDLLLVGERKLADAWVLVEPKDIEED